MVARAWRRAWLLWVVGVVVMLGATQLMPWGLGASEPKVSQAVVLPPIGIYDQISYERTESIASADGSGLKFQQGPETKIRIQGLRLALDSTTAQHVGIVAELATTPENPWQTSYVLDYPTRSVIQSEVAHVGASGLQYAFTWLGGLAGEKVFVVNGGQFGTVPRRVIDPDVLAYAGRSFTPGTDISATELDRIANTWNVPIDSFQEFSALVGEWTNGKHGEPLLPIHILGTIHLEGSPVDEFQPGDKRPFMTTRIGQNSVFGFERIVWLAPGIAYPVTVQDTFTGADHLVVVTNRSAFQTGGQPLLPPEVDLARPYVPIPASQSIGPAFGGSRCLDIEEMIEDFEADSSQIEFKAWKRAHPLARQIGLRVVCLDDGPRVSVQYGDPTTGQGFLARVAGGAPLEPKDPFGMANHAAARTQHQPNEFIPFNAARLEGNMTTWTDALEIWRRLVPPDSQARDPTYVGWSGIGGIWGSSLYPYHIAPELMFIQYGSNAMPLPTEEGNWLRAFLDARNGRLLAVESGRASTATGSQFVLDQELRAMPLGDEPSPDVVVSDDPRARLPELARLAAAGMALALLPWLLARAAGLLAGFVRVDSKRALQHPARNAIYNLIAAEPGIEPPKISKRCDLAAGTAKHHLRILERAGLILSVRDGRHKRLFEKGLRPEALVKTAALRDERTRHVYDLIRAEPGTFRSQLAQRLGLSGPAIGRHLNRLAQAGLVTAFADGKRVRYQAQGLPSQVAEVPDDRSAKA